ncbi:MAG: hypothetical protein US50_C0027G0005 [Candidatus Nomurabacteria bacterium GW2011_GWB1_37_5]|uniref:Type 4 fimbrial biogenesis protein PilX N-terminal domain-containing protein n=1 Tax=Candidatus Nomurabacteria bacterium GW2011_GWB1_37_5 TaxID=1618742 RepID=A0A0G0K332_9BACT|nr:MAG: hypothetical protein US50_C0027G0005 [Candidatus Nomurabacteria bacterium GW2011_GWB1_37_5]
MKYLIKKLLRIKDKGLRIDNKSSGFVILFTVLVASIVLLMTLGISNTSYREAILSQSARDGAYAFFAADTGAECALYSAIKSSAFNDFSNLPTSFSCADDSDTSPIYDSSALTASFKFNIDTKYCVRILVDKSGTIIPGISTIIESRGYNLPCSNVELNDVKAVERAIKVTY